MWRKEGTVKNLLIVYSATPIYIASQNGHYQVVEYLMDQGANFEAIFKYESLCHSFILVNAINQFILPMHEVSHDDWQ